VRLSALVSEVNVVTRRGELEVTFCTSGLKTSGVRIQREAKPIVLELFFLVTWRNESEGENSHSDPM
jgi:hypothetical protein